MAMELVQSINFLFFIPVVLESPDSDIGFCGWCLVLFSIILTILTLPVSIWMCIKVSGSTKCA